MCILLVRASNPSIALSTGKSNYSAIAVTKYNKADCTGSVVSNTTFDTDVCMHSNDEYFTYKCHGVVRPTCAYLQYNCSNPRERQKTAEFPCNICSGSMFNPLGYNFSCNVGEQTMIFNSQCEDGCGNCNQSELIHTGMCENHGSINWELVKIAPCSPRILTLTYSEANCSGHFRIASEAISGSCDLQTGEQRRCIKPWFSSGNKGCEWSLVCVYHRQSSAEIHVQ